MFVAVAIPIDSAAIVFYRFKVITGNLRDFDKFTKFMETLLENGGRHKEYFQCMSVEYLYFSLS